MPTMFGPGGRQVAASLILVGICATIASTYSVLTLPIGEEFQPSRMVLMLSITLLMLVAAFAAPVLGGLMDRISMRILMGVGIALVVGGYLALSVASSFVQVLLIYGFILGPTQVLIGPVAATVLLSRWFVRRRGAALGIAMTGLSVAVFVFPPILQTIIDHFEWRQGLRLYALVILVCTVPAVLMVINHPADRGLGPDGSTADLPGAAQDGEERAAISSREILSDPTFWLIGALFSVTTAGMLGTITSLVPLATDEGIAAGVAALLISTYAAAGFFAKLSFAALADRFNPRTLIFVGLFGFILGMACMTLAEGGIWVIAAGVIMISLFGGLMVPMQVFIVPRIFGDRVVGRAGGLLQTLTLVSMLLTPPIFGLIFDITGNYDMIFIIFSALAGGIMLIVPYMRLHPRERLPTDAGEALPAAAGSN